MAGQAGGPLPTTLQPLLRAARAGDGRAFGVAMLDVLDAGGRESAAEEALGALGDALRLRLPADPTVGQIAGAVDAVLAHVQSVVGVNRVLLEHTARASVDLSTCAQEIAPVFIVMYAVLLCGALDAVEDNCVDYLLAPPKDGGGTSRSVNEDMSDVAAAVDAAIRAATGGDADRWLERTAFAWAQEADHADRVARAELRARLDEQPIAHDDWVLRLAAGAEVLSATTGKGPFACAPCLVELAIRRAFGEHGCVDDVDGEELLRTTTLVAGLLDLADLILPPGWGLAVHIALE